MKKLLLLTTAMCWLISYSLQAEAPGYAGDPQGVSPQTATIIRFDNTPVNMNAGRIDLNIPLITLNDKDFDFPISLSYDSGGFKPSATDNYVGRNWALICGGVIYREVNGIPDDIESQYVSSDQTQYACGFFNILKNYKNQLNLNAVKSNIYTNPYLYAKRQGVAADISTIDCVGDKHIECSADVYNFSFGGYSGKFMINFDGSISSVTYSGGECKVDLSAYTLVRNTNPYVSKIKITTDNGYIYIFGGYGYGPLEYTALTWDDSFFKLGPPISYDISKGHTITAYYLTEIQAPNGRKLTIHYRDISEEIKESSPYNVHVNPLNMTVDNKNTLKYFIDNKINLLYSINGSSYFKGSMITSYDGVAMHSLQRHSMVKIALIDRIVTDNACIRFYYSKRNKLRSYSSPGVDIFPNHCGAKLDSIAYCLSESSAHEINDRCEVAHLNYVFASGDRMFLTGINNSKQGRYSMNYNCIEDVPSYLNANIDHWGYWRGRGTRGGILPAIHLGKPRPEEYTVSTNDREPTGIDCDATLLTEISYPTGGVTQFEYEPNTYSQRLEVHTPGFIPTMQRPQGVQIALAGGARIKSIKYLEEREVIKQTTYDYNYMLLLNGEVMYMPFYQYVRTYYKAGNTVDTVDALVRNSDGVTPPTHATDNVRYPYVVEKYTDLTSPTSQNGSYKLTSFTSYSSNPDIYSTFFGVDPFAFSSFLPGQLSFQHPDNLFLSDHLKIYNANLGIKPRMNNSFQRGKVSQEIYFTADGKKVRTVDYKYKLIPRDTVIYIYSLPLHEKALTSLYSHIGTEHFSKYLLSEKVITDYAPYGTKDGKTTVEQYTYNRNGYLTDQKMIRDIADTVITSYSYPVSYQIPPDKYTYAGRASGRVPIYNETYDAQTINPNLYRIKNVSVGDGVNSDMKVQYLKYDSYGNPLFKTENKILNTVYIWSHYGLYLLAKIENATYEEVENALGIAPEWFSSIGYVSYTNLDTLRKLLPKANVYTYSYISNVGVRTITDPSGQITSYEYDSAGRLSTVKLQTDSSKQKVILEKHNYHLLNQ